MKPTLPSASVAVITRTKNRPELVRRAMESVLGQTYQDWIHVIVNDGGEKEPLEVLARSYHEAYRGRLHIIHHESSKGMQNASNAGLDASESEYVTIHDDDDSWTPKFLEKTVSAIEQGEPHRKVDGAVCQSTRIFEEFTFGGKIRELKRSEYYYFEFANLNEMRRRNLFPPIAFIYRRKAHEQIGKFKQDYDVLGDHDFNLRFLRHYNITVLKDYLANYHWRMHAQGNTVTRGVEKHRTMLDRLKNDYLRETLSGSSNAIGDLDAIQFPPLCGPPVAPFNKRVAEAAEPENFPDPFADDDFKCLSLDVFDTALLRQCHIPTDVFKIVEARLSEELAELASIPFALARMLAEEKARKNLKREVTLDEIYIECAKSLELSPEVADRIKELELAVEEEMLYAHPKTLELARKAAQLGKEIIYISDMYLSASCIKKWLQKANFPDGEVFVSSELGESKHTGELYPIVLAQLQFQADDILHLGDNLQSDFVQAKASGLRALHLRPETVTKPWCDDLEPFVENTGDNWSSVLAGLVRRRHHEGGFRDHSLLYRLGYELAGPIYLSYLRWVCQHAKNNGIQRLLLLGRDGYYLEKSLREIGDSFGLGIEFTYIEASRKALCFASFEGLEKAALEFLSTPHPSLSAADFLSRLGLEWEAYTEALVTCGFDDPREIITKRGGGDFLKNDTQAKLEQLFHLIRPELERLFAGDRDAYTQLFDKNLSFNARTDAIVDLGWAASSAKALSKFFKTTASEPLHAYYHGTWKNAVSKNGSFIAHSYFMDKGAPADNAAILSESINWIEALFSAPFQTLLRLELKDGAITPVYSTDKGTGYTVSEQEAIWDGAKAFLSTARPFANLPVSSNDGWSYLSLSLKRLLSEPSPAELQAWGHLKHSDGFGLEMHQPLIIPCKSDASPIELLEAYDTSTWKRGFLSVVTESQAQFVIERRYPQPVKTYEEIQGEVLWLKQKQDEAWAETASLKAENEILKESSRKQSVIWNEDQQEIERLKQIIAEQSEQLKLSQKSIQTLQNENVKQAEIWETNQTEIKRLESAYQETETANRELQLQIEETGHQHAEIWKTNQAEIRRLEGVCEETRTANRELQLQVEQAERQRIEIDGLRAELETTIRLSTIQQETIEQKAAEVSSLHTNISQIQATMDRLREENQSLQAQLDTLLSFGPVQAMKEAWKRKSSH